MMRFAGSSMHADQESALLRYGQVLWIAEMQSGTIGIAWDWREIQDNVIVLADPMGIVGNVEFVDREGTRAPDGDRRILLNRAVFSLDWQDPAVNKKQNDRWIHMVKVDGALMESPPCG